MRSHSYLNSSKKIIETYDGSIPFAVWLKQFFKTDKKFGSKDRKQISHACYCFYRLGNTFGNLDFEERMLIALFLCSDGSNKILEELNPQWNEHVSHSLPEKLKQLSAKEEVKHVFPFADELSNEIDLPFFNISFLIQPDLYLRIRPGKEEGVIKQLQNAGMEFKLSGESVQLSNQSKVDEIFSIDEDVVIQDYNSQKTTELLNNSKLQTSSSRFSAWDCCAASGGKSILLYDHFPNVQLTVSDVRESILINLHKRFKKAGIKNYNWFIADVSSSNFAMQNKFDLVICDAPCSGSGTWSRTPEQLKFFKKESIDHYSNLQKKIVSNACKGVKPNGYFLYITCSVFKKENEEVVEFIKKNSTLQLQSMEYLKGYDKKADTLFAAVFSAL